MGLELSVLHPGPTLAFPKTEGESELAKVFPPSCVSLLHKCNAGKEKPSLFLLEKGTDNNSDNNNKHINT